MNNVAIAIVSKIKIELENMWILLIKNTEVSSLIMRMLAYSAIKIKANIPPLNSVLNPETNSDSPSAKSKGVRFVSAKLVINQKINISLIINRGQVLIYDVISEISIFWWIIKTLIRISDMDTSYEIVCATPRSAPNKEYLEFEHQPARKVEYTLRLDTHKKYIIPNVKYIAVFECG